MQVLSAVVVVANLVLSLVVGLRLLSLARRTGARPERALGVYFLASPLVSAVAMCAAYAGLSDPSLMLPDAWMRGALVIAALGLAVGAAGILSFTQLTFRAASAGSRHITVLGCVLLSFGLALEAHQDGFGLIILPGFGHWLCWAVRTGAFLWLAIECFRHWVLSRRRLRLGLAEPLIVNRLLLWGMFSAASFAVLCSDLLARVAYVRLAGTTTDVVPEVAGPLVVVTVCVAMLTGTVSAVTLVLAFFPTERYRSWIESRAALLDG